MKLIYRGGFNKHSPKSVGNSVIPTYDKFVEAFIKAGKKAAYVTLAKEDGDYESRFSQLQDRPVINWSNYQEADWDAFDLLILLGGYSPQLYKGLKESGFSLETLKKDAIVVGDSAGAYVLASCFVERHDLGKKVEFLPGFNFQAKLITLGHVDNPVYVDERLVSQVEGFAQRKGLSFLRLKENEERMLVDGKIIKFDRNEVFSL